MTDNKLPEISQEDKEAEAKKLAETQRKEKLKKEAAAKALLPKPKYYFDVKVECMLPATLTYRILAEDAQQAVELTKGTQPNSVRHKLIGRKEIKIMVYDAGSTMIKWIKNLTG